MQRVTEMNHSQDIDPHQGPQFWNSDHWEPLTEEAIDKLWPEHTSEGNCD